MPAFNISPRLKGKIRRWIGDPAVILEEHPNCPNLFHHYREMVATGHKRMPGGWEWEGKFYPDHLTVGGACFGAFRTAKKWCHGEGIDIGAGAWPFPGSKPIDTSWYPNGLKLEEVAAHSQDYVFTSHTLEHIKDWRGALAEFKSKIKPGGILFIYLPHPECGLWRMENPFMTKHHEWVPEPAIVKHALESLGLEIVDHDDGPRRHDELFHLCALERKHFSLSLQIPQFEMEQINTHAQASRHMLKEVVKQILPDAAYQRTAEGWRELRRSHEQLIWSSKLVLSTGCPDQLIYFGVAPGDDLLCTAVLREIKKRRRQRIWMMSKNPELFENNNDVDRIVPIDDRFRKFVLTFRKKWRQLKYATMDYERDMNVPPKRHIIAELCACVEVKGQIALRPYFNVKAVEKEKCAWAKGMIAIQSSGLAGKWPMQNKQWFPGRFQEVVDKLQTDFKFVQLGSGSDPALENVMNLRGKTSIRETAGILANSHLYLGNVGFLMHLARAVECPSVIIYGGREAPWQSGYSCNHNLYSAVPCAPCWLWNKCDHNRICMDMITADEVIDSVEIQMRKPRGELVVDETVI